LLCSVSFLCLVFAVRSINYRYIMYCKSVTLNYSRCESYNWNIFQFWIILYNVHGIHKSCEVVSLWCASGSGYGIKKKLMRLWLQPLSYGFYCEKFKKISIFMLSLLRLGNTVLYAFLKDWTTSFLSFQNKTSKGTKTIL
jgi:hypothetical protein